MRKGGRKEGLDSGGEGFVYVFRICHYIIRAGYEYE